MFYFSIKKTRQQSHPGIYGKKSNPPIVFKCKINTGKPVIHPVQS